MADDRRQQSDGPQPDPLPTREATWAFLLAKWTDFAQAAVALPRDGDGGRWRESVAPAITLQAVTMALAELHRLPPDERALGLDMAELSIRRAAAELHRVWRGEPMPERLAELTQDARSAVEEAAHRGVLWRAPGGAAEPFEMPSVRPLVERLVADRFTGSLLAAAPGTLLLPGSPALFVSPPPEEFDAAALGLERVEGPSPPVQVYRQIDLETWTCTHDLVAPLLTSLPPGRPLLESVLEHGRVVSRVWEHDAEEWREQQRSLFAKRVPTLRVFAEDQAGPA